MPGQPIDEYSVLLNLDATKSISAMIDAMEQIEEGWDQILTAANRMGDVDDEKMVRAIEQTCYVIGK